VLTIVLDSTKVTVVTPCEYSLLDDFGFILTILSELLMLSLLIIQISNSWITEKALFVTTSCAKQLFQSFLMVLLASIIPSYFRFICRQDLRRIEHGLGNRDRTLQAAKVDHGRLSRHDLRLHDHRLQLPSGMNARLL